MPYTPEIMELLRRIISEGKLSLHNVAILNALFYTLHTGDPSPPTTSLINEILAKQGVNKLGVYDKELASARFHGDEFRFALASDGGSCQGKAQYHGSVEVAGRSGWDNTLRPDGTRVGSFTEPIGCRDLGADSSEKNGTDMLLWLIQDLDMPPEMLSQLEGDSTPHAVNQREDTLTALENGFVGLAGLLKKLPTGQAVAENCYRHLTVLEENDANEAAYPKKEILNFLRMVHGVIQSETELYRQIWARAGLPPCVFEQLKSMPEPTTAKWEVMAECCRIFLKVCVRGGAER